MLNISGCVKRANNAQCSRWQYDTLFSNDTNFLCLLRFTFLFDEFQRWIRSSNKLIRYIANLERGPKCTMLESLPVLAHFRFFLVLTWHNNIRTHRFGIFSFFYSLSVPFPILFFSYFFVAVIFFLSFFSSLSFDWKRYFHGIFGLNNARDILKHIEVVNFTWDAHVYNFVWTAKIFTEHIYLISHFLLSTLWSS